MTTDVSLAVAPDLSVDNSVMNLGRFLPKGSAPLAGMAWLTRASPPERALALTMAHAADSLERLLPQLATWMLVGNSAWQPDSRVVRHRGLWGGLRARGIVVPDATHMLDSIVESEGRLKHFGAVPLAPALLPNGAGLMLGERCSYIVALPENVDLEGLLRTTWTGDLTRDTELIIAVSELGGLLLKSVGAFDDPERGLVAIGPPSLVHCLSQR